MRRPNLKKKQPLKADFLIAGLGNPGNRYRKTRHNIGFWVIDKLVDKYNTKSLRKFCQAELFETEIDDRKLLLAKPQTFVNASGESINCLLEKTGLSSDDLIIIHDDIDLAKGGVRVKTGGRSGGHRGIDSIIEKTGASEFTRIKIGVGRPPESLDPADFVLEEVADESELEILNEAVEKAIQEVEQLIS